MLMSAALSIPVAVMETAGEGGAWGIALLAAYMKNKKENQPLEDFLNENVFGDMIGECVFPDKNDADGFAKYMERYKSGLAIERAAVDNLI